MAIIFIAIVGLSAHLLLKPNSKPEVSADDDPFIGPENATVTVIEFFDFQCPACRAAEPILKQVREKYKDRVKFVARDFPLPQHQFAQKASEASECAHEQGKYWEFYDLAIKGDLFVDDLKQYAKDLSLNVEQFNQCLDSGKYYNETRKDYDDAVSYGLPGTPTFFVNGKMINVRLYSDFERAIESALNV